MTAPAQSARRRVADRGRHSTLTMIVLSILLVVLAIISLAIGRYGMPINEILSTIWHTLGDALGFDTGAVPGEQTQSRQAVLFAVRIPRILTAIIVGAALAAAGAAYQGLFRNPMVSPDLLGVSSGASVGATLAILLGLSSLQIQVAAFAFAIGAVTLVLSISAAVSRTSGGGLLVLVLAGIVISSLASAATSLVKYLAPPETVLPEVTFWLMGSFATTGSWFNVALLAGALVVGGVPLMLLRWRINVLSFGEEEARALGVNTTRTRMVIIVCATVLTAVSVALCGVIGWVGLVIPHIGRFLVGPNYLRLLPTSMLVGAVFMLLVDDVARTATAGEIPLGILTAILGAPLFIYLLFRGGKSWT